MYDFFSKFGDVVDLNLDYYPDKIILTFAKHSDVLKVLAKDTLTYQNSV